MAEYDFYAGILRFVASTSARSEGRIATMMDCLDQAATAIEADQAYTIEYDQRELFARALAGVAAFLQERILPETVAEANQQAELQVRWAIDRSMEAMTHILQVQSIGNQEPITITFPAPPTFHAP